MKQVRKPLSGNITGTWRFFRVDTPADSLDYELIGSFACLLKATYSGGQATVSQEHL
ncbi:MAG: hypothetical protein JWP08_3404 [Bryobacterales bacterium]|jgi:hypothetical protein|nr:hypothetical protein [Bryobacterales bacterium]